MSGSNASGQQEQWKANGKKVPLTHSKGHGGDQTKNSFRQSNWQPWKQQDQYHSQQRFNDERFLDDRI